MYEILNSYKYVYETSVIGIAEKDNDGSINSSLGKVQHLQIHIQNGFVYIWINKYYAGTISTFAFIIILVITQVLEIILVLILGIIIILNNNIYYH